KRSLALGRDFHKQLVVTNDSKEHPIAIETVFSKHLFAADTSRLLHLLCHIFHKLCMRCHVQSLRSYFCCNQRPNCARFSLSSGGSSTSAPSPKVKSQPSALVSSGKTPAKYSLPSSCRVKLSAPY